MFGEGIRAAEFGGRGVRSESPNNQHRSNHGQYSFDPNIGFGGTSDVNSNFQSGAQLTTLPSMQPLQFLTQSGLHQQAHQEMFGNAGLFPYFQPPIAPSTGPLRGREGLQAYSAPGLHPRPPLPPASQHHQGGVGTAGSLPEFESLIAPPTGRGEGLQGYTPFNPYGDASGLHLPAAPPQLRQVARQAQAEAHARAKARGYAHTRGGPQAVARAEALAQVLGGRVWPVKAHTFPYADVLADSKLKDIIYSIEPDHRHTLAHHLYSHSPITQKYWWLIQIITPITRLPPELLQQILLLIIDEASDSPLALMLVCKHWYDVITGIWASLKLGTTTPKDAVITKLERNQWFLDVVVDTEIDRSHFTSSEGAYQAIFAAIEATDRWRSFVVETFPPQADLPEHLVNGGLRIRTFRIKSACEMSPLLDRVLRILGKSASRELTTVEINSPSVISFLAPTYPSTFNSIKVLSLHTRGLRNPVDLLPHLYQLESLTASHLSFPIYNNDVDLPFVHTLRHLSLRAVSIQWMSGRTFRALESCTLLLPLHRHILHTFSATLPRCKQLTFQGYPLDILTGVSAHNLINLSVVCSSVYKPRGNRELIRFSSHALRESRLSPRVLHISIEATSEAWIKAIAFMVNLEELVIDNAQPSSLEAQVLRLLVVQSVDANNPGTTTTPGCRKTPVLPSLRRFGLRYRRWLRPSEPFDLIPEFMSIILSRQRLKFPLQSLQIWIRSDEKDPLELIDGSWVSLEGFGRLMNASAINVLRAMASKFVENMVKPSWQSSTACRQRPQACQPLLPPPRTPLAAPPPSPAPPPPPPHLPHLPTPRVSPSPPPHLLDLFSSMPDPVSSRSLTVLVRRPYQGQCFQEINLIEGEYIYNVERFDNKWWSGTTVDGKKGFFPASYVKENAASKEAEVPPLLLPVKPAPKTRIPTVYVTRPYGAQGDNETILIEGGYIEQSDDGWWRGTTTDGKTGLFPVKESAPPLLPVRTSSASGLLRSQQGQKKGKRKGRSVMVIHCSAGRYS